MPNDNDRILPLRALLERVPFSRTHLYRLEKAGLFPRRLKLGARRIGWRASDVTEWISSRADEANRDGGDHE